MSAEQKQSVDAYRKVALRKNMCRGSASGAVYVPFCGDGDMAVACFQGRDIFAADLDPVRVATCRSRLPGAVVRQADCDEWPFPDITTPFAIADFDAYANPYPALVAFWQTAQKASKVVLFGTDALRYRMKRSHVLKTLPHGSETKAEGQEWRAMYNFWWPKHVLPFLAGLVSPYTITKKMNYMRGRVGMLYWSIVVEKRR